MKWPNISWNGIKKFFRLGSNTVNPESNLDLGLEQQNEALPPEVARMAEGMLLSKVVPVELRKLPGNYVAQCWNMGYNDGMSGQPVLKHSYFSNLAHHLNSLIVPGLNGELEKCKKEYQSKRKEFDETENLLHKIQKFIDEMLTRRALKPSDFSRSLMYIYFISSIVLLIADVPLSLMVTEHVFDVASYEGHGVANLFTYEAADDALGCTSFVDHYQTVLFVNWQIVLMSLGIVLSAIFFKMIYEELMLTPLDRSALQFRNLLSVNNAVKVEEQESVIQDMKVQKGFRLFFILLILIAIVLTLVIFGNVRFNVEQAIMEGQPGKNINEQFFLAISILFPLLSGICFAVASHISNKIRLSDYFQNEFDEWKIKLRELHGEILHLDERMATLTELIKKYDTENLDKAYEGLLNEAYTHGYGRGAYAGLNNSDTYDLASVSLKRFLITQEYDEKQKAHAQKN